MSNSSSSSFLLQTKKELTTEYLTELFQIEPDNIMYLLSQEIIQTIVNRCEDRDLKEILKNKWYDIKDKVNNELKYIYEICLSYTQGEEIEDMILQNMIIDKIADKYPNEIKILDSDD